MTISDSISDRDPSLAEVEKIEPLEEDYRVTVRVQTWAQSGNPTGTVVTAEFMIRNALGMTGHQVNEEALKMARELFGHLGKVLPDSPVNYFDET